MRSDARRGKRNVICLLHMTAVSFKLPYAVIFYICQVKHNKREAGGEKSLNKELFFFLFAICAYDTIWHRGGKLIQTLSSTNIPKVASSAAPPDARSTQVKVLQYQARLFLSWIFFSLNFLFFFSCILRNVDNVPETRCPLWLPAPISVIFAICFPQRLPFIFFAFLPLSHSLSISPHRYPLCNLSPGSICVIFGSSSRILANAARAAKVPFQAATPAPSAFNCSDKKIFT